MTNEEAAKKLKAKLYCMTRETSGTEEDCNEQNCNNCPYNYKQGNMGEQKEALNMAIKALEQQNELFKQETAKDLFEVIKENITYDIDAECITPTITASIYVGRK